MKKIFSLFTILAMVSNSAFAAVGNDNIDLHSKMIAKTFNEFRYKMTVEVDPNDPNYQTNAVTDFKQKLENDTKAKWGETIGSSPFVFR